jgi:D-3-phosphoglycerate dehydrogenase / 2-oxoglutarate reductase
MANVKVLVSDKLSEAGIKVLEDAAGVDVDYKPGISEDELVAIIGVYHGLVIRSGTKVTPRVVEAARELKVIGRAGIGIDNVDVPASSRRGIVVMNTPTGNAVTTAEHALTLLLSLARKIPNAVASTRAGKWEKNKFEGREIANKSLGIIGLGNIGRIVADRAQGLKMKVLGSDPFMTRERAAQLGIELVHLDELLTRADFVTLHTPLTAETTNLIDSAAFKKMKKTALLVNAARGGIVDEDALLQAIESGEIAGAAMDVFVTEPLPTDHPFLAHPNILCTPHLGASTHEAQERVAVEIAQQVVDFLLSGTVTNAVNVPALPAEAAERVQPYANVARKMGSLIGQLEPVDGTELRVTCTGEPGELGVTPIARAALAGYLEHHLEGPVNPISAPYEAKERGIDLVEVKEPPAKGFADSIRVVIKGDGGIHTATGIVDLDGELRLIGLDGYKMNAVMSGTILIILNQDRPGVIGAVGSVLGRRAINVSRLQVGLDESRGQALALYNVDGDVPRDAMDELRAIDNVSSVLSVTL